MALIELDKVKAGYGQVPVLHGIDLHVDEGEVVALFGPNGAGKSTLAKCIFGALAIDGGAIRYKSVSLETVATDKLNRMGLAYVPQEGNSFPELSVEDNLRVGLAGRRDLDRSTALARAFEMFPVLQERRNQGANTLSGGERQMLALASAVVLDPTFLLIDEPTSGLAPILVDRLIEKALEIAKLGTTVLWIVGDDATKILPHADRRYLMRSGVIEGEWDRQDVASEADLADLYFSASSATA